MLLHKEFYADVPRISRDRNLIRDSIHFLHNAFHYMKSHTCPEILEGNMGISFEGKREENFLVSEEVSSSR